MDSIQTLIAACDWAVPRFMIFSANVFDPLVYYSHLVPLILSLIIGGFVFLKSRELLLSRILLAVTLLFTAWAFFDMILWATDKPYFTIFFWSMEVLIEPMIYAAMFYFVYVFIHNTDNPFWHKLAVGALLLPTILLTPTHFAIEGFDLTSCDREAVEGALAHYGYAVEILFTTGILAMAARRLWTEKDKILRREVVLVTAGAVLFLAAFSWGNIIGTLTEDWGIPQWGLFGMPIFLAFLSYLIVRFRLFNIKLIATQALVFTLAILIGSQFFFITRFENRVLNGLTFGVAVVAGLFLVRSVKREVQQREEIQVLANNLENLLHLVSHGFKGPLTDVRAFVGNVREGAFGEFPPEVLTAMADVEKKIVEGIQGTETILKARDAKTGRMKYEKNSFDLKELVVQATDMIKHDAETKGLHLQVEIPDEATDWTIIGDKTKLFELVLHNLLMNAVLYTPQGSIIVRLEKVTGKVRFSVRDSGIGLTDQDKAKLFTEGGHGKDSAKINVHSTGYGLYLAKSVVDEHKGRIWAESQGPGKGSTFFTEFPGRV
jgi:signal transduction histidine kinase